MNDFHGGACDLIRALRENDRSLEGNWGTLGWRPPLSTKVSAGWPCGIGPGLSAIRAAAAARESYPRAYCYNVVTRVPTVGNDSVVSDSKREKGVQPRYALLGTRSAGGGRRPGDRLGALPIGPPLALAASRGPGLTQRILPRPANSERGEG